MNMKVYQYNYLIIYLLNYADIMTAFKDTIRLCIKVPYTLLTWSFPGLESITVDWKHLCTSVYLMTRFLVQLNILKAQKSVIHLLH